MEYFKYRELEFNERINVPETSFISDRKTHQAAQQLRFRVYISGIFVKVSSRPFTLLLVCSPPRPNVVDRLADVLFLLPPPSKIL